MTTRVLRVRDFLNDRILIGRESARLLESELRKVISCNNARTDGAKPTEATIDFAGVEGIAPSFLDELLRVFESLVAAEGPQTRRRLIVANPPTRLSLKFEAVARGHGMSVKTVPDGSWVLGDARTAGG